MTAARYDVKTDGNHQDCKNAAQRLLPSRQRVAERHACNSAHHTPHNEERRERPIDKS